MALGWRICRDFKETRNTSYHTGRRQVRPTRAVRLILELNVVAVVVVVVCLQLLILCYIFFVIAAK